MADSPFWMIWPGNAALSALTWFVIAMPFLYAARAPVHGLLRSLGQLAGGPLRLASRALLASAQELRERNRTVLLAQGREESGDRLAREFERVAALVKRDLEGYPALQRKLLDEITRVEEDYKKCGEVPPPPPDWVDAVAAVAKIKPNGNELVQRVLEEINRSVNRSLEKLGIDHADLILLHRPDYLMDPTETGGALDGLISDGKTKFVGVSNFSPSRISLLAHGMKAPIVTNQIEFSPLHLDPISDGTFDTALRRGHRPMIWSPVGGGRLLTGDEPDVAKIRTVLAGIAETYGLDGPAEAAIAFVVRHPAGGVPIVGSGKRERMLGAIKAAATVLDRQDWYAVVAETSPMLSL